MLFSLQFTFASIAQCKQKLNMRQRYWQTRNRIETKSFSVRDYDSEKAKGK